MVYGQGHAVDAAGRFLFEVPVTGQIETGDPYRLLSDCYMALPGGDLTRRSVLNEVCFFEEAFRAGQDHEMALRIVEVDKTASLPMVVGDYRIHEDSISAKELERRWKTGIEILRRTQKRYPYRKSTIRKLKAVLYFRLSQSYWKERGKLKAVPHLLSSVCLDPLHALNVLLGRERV